MNSRHVEERRQLLRVWIEIDSKSMGWPIFGTSLGVQSSYSVGGRETRVLMTREI